MKRKVLIAEDDAPVGAYLRQALADRGFEAETVPDGAQAMARAAKEEFDAAVLDIHMPGINGIEAAEAIRRRRPEMPLAIVSGMATEATEESVAAIGGAAFLAKPVDVDALVEALAPRHPPVPGWKVLVVEDFAPIRGLLGHVLEGEGWGATLVDNGDAAIAEARRRGHDIALVDLAVPGACGAWLVAALREADPAMYLVMVTGEARSEEITRGYAAGADALVRKPFTPDGIADFLKSRRREVEERRRRGAAEIEEETLPIWKRAAKDGRRIAEEVREGKHRDAVTTIVAGAAALVVALLFSWGWQEMSEQAAQAEAEIKAAEARFLSAQGQEGPVVIIQTGAQEGGRP